MKSIHYHFIVQSVLHNRLGILWADYYKIIKCIQKKYSKTQNRWNKKISSVIKSVHETVAT